MGSATRNLRGLHGRKQLAAKHAFLLRRHALLALLRLSHAALLLARPTRLDAVCRGAIHMLAADPR
jgi:hypothetical protein